MSISRKCPECGTWNEGSDYCRQCNHLLNYEIQRSIEIAEKKKIFAQRQKDKVELWLAGLKASRYWIIRGIYHILYSIWFVFVAFLSLLLALITFAAG